MPYSPKICAIEGCETLFVPAAPNGKYCSDLCRKKGRVISSLKWEKLNPEKTRTIKRRTRNNARKNDPNWHKKHQEQGRRFRKANPEKVRAYGRKHYWKNPEKQRERNNNYKKANPEKVREYSRKRRLLLQNGPSYRRQASRLLAEFGPICQICKTPLEIINDKLIFDVDHKIPISKEGTNEYENLQLSHPTCNRRKGAK